MASNYDRKSGSSAHSSRRGSDARRSDVGASRRTGTKQTIDLNVTKKVASERRGAVNRERVNDAPPSRSRRGSSGEGSASRRKDSELARAAYKAASAKAQDRERRERERRHRTNLRIAAVVLVVAAVLGGSFAIYRSTFLLVENVMITGTRRLTQDEVLSLAGIPDDMTMLRVPVKNIEARIEGNPFVESARVTRRLPTTVVIKVVEREPFSVLELTDGSQWLISRDLHWLGEASAEETGSMLVVRNTPVDEARAGDRIDDQVVVNVVNIITQLSEELRAMTASISAPSIGKTELLTKEGVSIFLGSSDQLAVKDELARRILAENPGQVVYINVRVPDKAVWRGL